MSDIIPPIQEDRVEPSEMVLQILSSLRNIDGVIDTLVDILRRDICRAECREELRERVDRLMQTRFCLVYSLMDIRPSLVKILEINSESILSSNKALYDSIKRHGSR